MADYKVKLTRAASITSSVTGGQSSTASGTMNSQINSASVAGTVNAAIAVVPPREQVVFDATPEFSESRTVNYKSIDPIHAPGGVYMYANTQARTFNIQGKLISRSVFEATKNLAYMQYLRTWAMPVFGTIGANSAPGEGILGAPPALLLLTAYSKGNPGSQAVQKTVPASDQTQVPAIGNNIYQVPVIITQLDIPYPSDVDYIPTINQIPVPTIVTISISLVEAHSPNAYQKFTIQDFKTGNLLYF